MDKPKQEDKLAEHAVHLLNEQYEANSEFNSYFDSDEPITIGAMAYPRSKVLFMLDREAYFAERDSWKNDAIEELHRDTKATIKANGNETPLLHLIEAVSRQRLVPFVGAGLSRPMGLPLWVDALKKLRERLPNLQSPAFDQLVETGKFLEAAQILCDHDTILTNQYIRNTFRITQIAGPVALLPRIATGCVVTTNFDNAIEEVFRREGFPFDGYMHGKQQHNFFPRLVRGERCILKLHGDADDPHTYILTKEQYLDAYREPFDFHLSLPKALRQIFVSNSFLFLGCSLDGDWTLELFKAVKDLGEYELPTHFALLPTPDTPQEKQNKESRLLTLNIEPIWYPTGQHDFVEKLLQLVIDMANKRIALNL